MRYLFIVLLFIGLRSRCQSLDSCVYYYQSNLTEAYNSERLSGAYVEQAIKSYPRMKDMMFYAKLSRRDTEDAWIHYQAAKVWLNCIIGKICLYLR